MNDQQRYVFEHPRCYGFNAKKHFQTGAACRDRGRWRAMMTIEPRGKEGFLSWVCSISRYNKVRKRVMEKYEWTSSVGRGAADQATLFLAGVGEGVPGIQEEMDRQSRHAMFFYKPLTDDEAKELTAKFGPAPEAKDFNIKHDPELQTAAAAEANRLTKKFIAEGMAPEDAVKAAYHRVSIQYKVKLLDSQGLRLEDSDPEGT